MTENKDFDINSLAIQYGEYYKIDRRENESDHMYRSRVAGELRGRGKLIEAHEAISGRRYDDPYQGALGPLTGIMGALNLALNGRNFSSDPERMVGDDIVAGAITRYEDNSGREAIARVFGLVGPGAGMDLLEAMRREQR